jgi:hypothetical protein
MEILMEESNDTKENILAHNMKISDENLIFNHLVISSVQWFYLNKDKTPQDLEKYFRNNNMNTHIIACPVTLRNDCKLDPINSNIEPLYECIYSCRPKKYAMEEIHDYWSSYEENFEKLKYAGRIIVPCEPTSDDEPICNEFPVMEKFNEEQKTSFPNLLITKKMKIQKKYSF